MLLPLIVSFCCLFLSMYVPVFLILPCFQTPVHTPVLCMAVLLLLFHQLLSWVTSQIYLPPCGSSLVIFPLCCCFWVPVSLFWIKILQEKTVWKHLLSLFGHFSTSTQAGASTASSRLPSSCDQGASLGAVPVLPVHCGWA